MLVSWSNFSSGLPTARDTGLVALVGLSDRATGEDHLRCDFDPRFWKLELVVDTKASQVHGVVPVETVCMLPPSIAMETSS